MNDPISKLLHGYARAIDEEQYEAWPEFFTADAYYQITTRELLKDKMPIGILECRNQAMMKDRIFSMLNANIYAPHHYRHLLSAPQVLEESDGETRLYSSFGLIRIMAGGTSEMFLSGYYADRIDTSGPEYRFRERIVVLDSSRVDTLIVAPV